MSCLLNSLIVLLSSQNLICLPSDGKLHQSFLLLHFSELFNFIFFLFASGLLVGLISSLLSITHGCKSDLLLLLLESYLSHDLLLNRSLDFLFLLDELLVHFFSRLFGNFLLDFLNFFRVGHVHLGVLLNFLFGFLLFGIWGFIIANSDV